jgi:hypothetical protein
MEKEFVTYEQALLLKELGFGEMCFGFYRSPILELMHCKNSEPWMGNTVVAAPLKQQAFRWFREKYGIDVSFTSSTEQDEHYYGFYTHGNYDVYETDFFPYEEAENACIDKLLEIAKEQVS